MSASTDWDDEASRFDEAADHGLSELRVRAAWRRLLDASLPPPPAHIADLGCGTGSLSVLLSEAGYGVTAVDSSPAMLALAIAKSDALGQAVRFALADAAAPPLRPGSVDVVLCRHVLWTMPAPAAALERWAGLLAPGGRLVLIEGRWSTGAGLSAVEVESLLARVASGVVTHELTDPTLWGGPTNDERFLIVASVDPAERSATRAPPPLG